MLIHSRLLACMNLIQGNFLCDVGTDHALLPVYAIQKNIIQQAIACDIGKLPLESARKTVQKYQLADKIALILSDGLRNINHQDITDIVIAGMGGETIIHVLQDTCAFSLADKNLILQPMTKSELLRVWLYQNGYEIQQEICIPDGKFLYAVLQVQYSGICKNPNARETYFGKMNLSDKNGLAYANRQYQKLCKARQGRLSAGQDITELEKSIQELEGYLSCKS
ncbi:MAG: class I SAM-dependent methyltransferase [Oscillospiraceae bacterium]|nr:class I SAM-dependent methyltransferase [Oscillospiraceae bacterium]